ncbi:FtsX-like permease family protein [Stappia sp. GBMRC 2046]|uniref:FtsX-like permease family protein n=1 Tax=Stappia sediminis TaxID=2692190 RepID=A0A7X3S974_9HYPH|nr:ABC transporter permease [Stappia sediminis]MXN66554.1 FtsX-like permease family protein [Stappia sediminis]
MNLLESLKIALRSLRANPVRSLLTMLGIIIGVASVVTMVAVGQGAQTQVAEQIRTLGSNVLMVQPGTSRQGGARGESGSGHTLSESDATAISELSLVEAAAPSIRGNVQIVAGNRNWNTTVNGTTTAYFFIREWALAQGRYFSEGEEASAGKVALIGRTVAEQLFGNTEAIGGSIRILQVPFRVIGILDEKGPSGTGRDQDDVVFIPISTAKLRLIGSAHQTNREAVAYILAKARPGEGTEPAERQIADLLRQRHRLQPGEEDDFLVTNPAAAMAAERAATRTIAWLLAAIASVSLLVGGISIMNIMLVSVTERTREIGLRMAVGARRRDIRNQFLIEALCLCLLGGLIGLVFGVAVSIAIARLANWPIFLAPEAMLAAIAFSGAVGIFFGYYPARRAAALEPIECLRSE